MEFIPIIEQNLASSQLKWLEHRFFQLCDSTELWDEIVAKYSESHRAYHNLSHIYSLFKLLDEAGFSQNNSILEWTIWYHDIIYNAKKKDNEKQSAILFEKRCKDIVEENTLKVINSSILSTEKHFPLSDEPEVKWMLDLDLFILTSPEDIYNNYAAAIRKEYSWVPKILYKRGRKKVLESFLKRDRIYFSDYFYRTYEPKARENLKNELNRL